MLSPGAFDATAPVELGMLGAAPLFGGAGACPSTAGVAAVADAAANMASLMTVPRAPIRRS